ncbi:N-acetyltransferase [Thiorhodococcus minor]|uniref:N-acetyltransferase n=2 Tax=Thiorhodococcus minor TaxID=57489 RepID=A0A6M0JXZ3_9GAMM|nr:N-acetyltransferase [Thiorhodococcus minor]
MPHIRLARGIDHNDIRDIYLRAFPEGECKLIARLALSLLSEESNPETIGLVAEADGRVVGHVAFSPVTTDGPSHWLGYILAPLAVKPEYQKGGIGSALIRSGIEQLSIRGVDAFFVYGDPEYYGRFGFTAEAAGRFLPPYELQYPFGWQAMVMHETVSNGQTVKLSCVASLREPALW